MNTLVEKNKSWKTVRLGDVAKTSSGETPKRGVAAYYEGGIPWVKSGELGDSTVYETQEKISQAGLDGSSAKLFPKGTLCVALYGATVGKLGILGMDAATNQAVCGIFLPKEIDTRFAYRFLESKRKELIEMGKGGAQSNISQEIIRDLQFPFPSTDEQQQIVAEIEKQFTRLEAGVAALKRVQANLKHYRAAVLKAACEGKLVPTEAELHRQLKTKNSKFETGAELLARILTERRQQWNGKGKYKEPAAPDITSLPQLPEGWVWTRMDMVCTKIQDGTHFSPKEQSTTGDFKYITAKNIKTWGLDLSQLTYIPAHVHREISARCNPEKGDILFIKDGVTTGIATVNPLDEEFSLLSSVALLKPIRGYLDSYFLKHWLNSPVGFRAMTGQMTGTAIKRVILEKIKESAVPLPPLAEQARIVAEVERRLSVLEELEAVVSANLQRAIRLRQSILQKAFSGNLLSIRS